MYTTVPLEHFFTGWTYIADVRRTFIKIFRRDHDLSHQSPLLVKSTLNGLRHLEAATAAASIAPSVSDNKGAGAENEPTVDGESAGAHNRASAAHFQAPGFDIEPSGLDGSCPGSLDDEDTNTRTLMENAPGGDVVARCTIRIYRKLSGAVKFRRVACNPDTIAHVGVSANPADGVDFGAPTSSSASANAKDNKKRHD